MALQPQPRVPVVQPSRVAPSRLRRDAAALEQAFRRAAVIHAALLKLSSLELHGLDTRAYRATVDAEIAVIESADNAPAVHAAVRQIAAATQAHLRTQQELLDTREAEFSETVALLTEAVVQFRDTNASFAEQMLDRSDRMSEIIAIDDLRTLRLMLSQELSELREATVTKQRADAEQIAALSSKVEALEARLALAVTQAASDALTGAHNRAAWEQRMAELAIQMENGNDAFALALIDVDNFKQINDNHGHAAGDAALVAFADLARQAFGTDDFVARFGGDEFAVLLAAPTLEHAADHIERLLASIRKANLSLRREADRPQFTVSVGLAPASSDITVQTLLNRADTALYAAKQAGRDRLVVANE